MTDDREHPSHAGHADGGISRRRFAAVSGAALLGSILGAPGSLAALEAGSTRRSARGVAGTFELRVTIVGLCFFVPDPVTRRMHVLMPNTTGHAHGGVSRHVARLLYDAAHERAGSAELAGAAVTVPLENGSLDLARLGRPLDLALPGTVVDVSPIVRDGVSRETLSGDAAGRLRARLSFDAGRMSAPSPALRWDLGPYRRQRMANAVEWTIPGIRGDEIELPTLGLDGRPGPAIRALHPVNGMVDLVILHVVPEEVLPFGRAPELPRPGFASTDFGAYYGLFENPADRPLPRFVGDDETPGAVQVAFRGTPARQRTAFGSTPWACLVGGGTVKRG
ncbi:MAG TPA: hypothetical protein VEX86_20425 [Longimicrobium sp.]|nr:hypothetical protein [Longimicrobium sp.]